MRNTYQEILSFSPKSYAKIDVSLITIISQNRVNTVSHRQDTTHRQHCLPEKHSEGNQPNQCSNNNSFPRAPKKALSRLPLFWEQRNGLLSQTEKNTHLLMMYFILDASPACTSNLKTTFYVFSFSFGLHLLHNNHKTTFELCTEFS